MARRFAVLASAACVALGAAGCGGEDTPDDEPAPRAATTATEPDRQAKPDREAKDDRAEPRRDERPQEDREAGRDTERQAEREEPVPDAPPADDTGERAPADAEQVQRTVGQIVAMISRADARVCRRFFTPRYAEYVSKQTGDAAFRRCEEDIGRSKGELEVVDFQETRVDGDRAVVRFRMRVPGGVSTQGWRMVQGGARWLVDAER